jgi:hypothetical protein
MKGFFSNGSNVRDPILKLSYVSKQKTGPEIPLDIGLLIGYNFSTEEVLEIEISVEIFLQIYKP